MVSCSASGNTPQHAGDDSSSSGDEREEATSEIQRNNRPNQIAEGMDMSSVLASMALMRVMQPQQQNALRTNPGDDDSLGGISGVWTDVDDNASDLLSLGALNSFDAGDDSFEATPAAEPTDHGSTETDEDSIFDMEKVPSKRMMMNNIQEEDDEEDEEEDEEEKKKGRWKFAGLAAAVVGAGALAHKLTGDDIIDEDDIGACIVHSSGAAGGGGGAGGGTAGANAAQ